MPIVQGKIFSTGVRNTAPGAIDDARPDRWGERIIRHIDRPARLSILEMLLFAGDDRFGALGVSQSHMELLAASIDRDPLRSQETGLSVKAPIRPLQTKARKAPRPAGFFVSNTK